MKILIPLALSFFLLLGTCGCEDPLKGIGIAKPVDKGKNENPAGPGHKNKELPEMGSFQVFNLQLDELSGLCMNKDSTALWGVGDGGLLCKVSFTGSASRVLSFDLDAEGLTINPSTGDLYIAVEGDQMVCRVAAPDYQTVDTLFYIQEAILKGFENNGLEGIAFYGDSLLFVGSQEDALVWTCTLDGEIVSRVSLLDESPQIEEVAGLYYDATRKWLWVTDSDAFKIFIFSADDFDLVATYDIPMIENAESICVDRKRNCVWIGSDEDRPKLYRFSFSF